MLILAAFPRIAIPTPERYFEALKAKYEPYRSIPGAAQIGYEIPVIWHILAPVAIPIETLYKT